MASIFGITITSFPFCFVKPPSLPTIPKIFEFIFFAYLIASTKFKLTFFSKLPPPTERIKIPSFLFNLLTRNHSEKELFHPSSLIRAENSETLSVGV